MVRPCASNVLFDWEPQLRYKRENARMENRARWESSMYPAPLGAKIRRVPLTPEYLWSLIREAHAVEGNR